VEIEFTIGDIPAKLLRGSFLGGMELILPGERLWLQHPLHPGTHFSFRLERHWQRIVAGHRVRIEKSRPLLLAGVRPQWYRVFVDDQLVASVRGV